MSGYEIELKILEIDSSYLINRLQSLGAELVRPKTRFFIFEYDFPDFRLKKNGALCRVRSEGDKIVWCYKGKKDKGAEKLGFKKQPERQEIVSSLENTCRMLEDLGMIKVAVCEKDRFSYSFGGAAVDVDKLPNICEYAEVEASSESVVEKVVKKLGYKMNQTCTKSWKEVLRHYGVNTDVVPLVVRF